VFTLLGTDARFHVDSEGFWSIAAGAEALGRPLKDLSFAVVDVETTGGGPGNGHRITEVAAVEVRGGTIVDEWHTLVNPGRSIPRVVTTLTGISTGMVRDAPYFEHVAPEVRERLEGRVFVAHNVAFDWRFVSSELAEAGSDVPPVPRLCTVRLSKALVPRLRRRNLDALAGHFGIPVHDRHRAHGDALATARVLIRLLDEAAGRGIGDLHALQQHVASRRRRRRRDGAQTELLDGRAARTSSEGGR
jgi:DNA polymerase-3 subunit epsilon